MFIKMLEQKHYLWNFFYETFYVEVRLICLSTVTTSFREHSKVTQ